MNAVLCSAQVSLVRVSGLPSILSPTTQHPPAVALAHNPSARRACCGPLPAHTSFGMYDRRLRTSPTGCRLARMPGRIEFVILRTARLPPVLPTPPHGNAVAFSSRPEYAYLERTCTSDQTRSQTVHPHRLVRWVNQADELRVKARNNPPFASAAANGGGRGEGKPGGCALLALACQPDSPAGQAGRGRRWAIVALLSR